MSAYPKSNAQSETLNEVDLATVTGGVEVSIGWHHWEMTSNKLAFSPGTITTKFTPAYVAAVFGNPGHII